MEHWPWCSIIQARASLTLSLYAVAPPFGRLVGCICSIFCVKFILYVTSYIANINWSWDPCNPSRLLRHSRTQPMHKCTGHCCRSFVKCSKGEETLLAICDIELAPHYIIQTNKSSYPSPGNTNIGITPIWRSSLTLEGPCIIFCNIYIYIPTRYTM